MDAVETLQAIESIKKLKASYFRFMDTKDWAGFRSVFVDDLHVEMPDDDGSIRDGADDFVAMVQASLGPVITVHHGRMPEIDIVSATEAKGVWAMEDRLTWPDGATTLHGWGHYTENYRLIDGQWRIARLRLTRLRVESTLPSGA